MKLARIEIAGEPQVVVVHPDTGQFWPLIDAGGSIQRDMVDVVAQLARSPQGLRKAETGGSLADVKLLPPIRPPRNIFCVGKNYHAHALEFSKSGFDSSSKSPAEAIPDAPIIFTKAPQSVVANEEPIRCPAEVSQSVDYEAELAVVIGKGGRSISRQCAMDHVYAYTVLNDVTARDLQSKHKQWFLGKSIDTFCPMGPWLVTADEVDVRNLDVRCWVNGELRQNANTRDLIFDVPTLIETISNSLSLMPGDVIATGTPAGVGIGFTPPRYLSPGDTVTIEITGIGRLTNRFAG